MFEVCLQHHIFSTSEGFRCIDTIQWKNSGSSLNSVAIEYKLQFASKSNEISLHTQYFVCDCKNKYTLSFVR